jgi:lipoprotein-anchoring transpeptidase ErfK/SrfK
MRTRSVLVLAVAAVLVTVVVGVAVATLLVRPGADATAGEADAIVTQPVEVATSPDADVSAGFPDPAPPPADPESPSPHATGTAPGPATTAVPSPPADPVLDLRTVQTRLRDQGYYVGEVDGVAGSATRYAVMAFQKVNGLQVDGVVGPRTSQALDDPATPEVADGPPTRVDVDLDRQVLHVVVDGERIRTLPVSSGSGGTYTTSSGSTARSLTPTGTFAIQRDILGLREADLGALYNPKYYHRGWAIHGSPSVPAHPASHGCVRIPIADSRWLFDRVPVGTTVIVRGGTHVFAVGG